MESPALPKMASSNWPLPTKEQCLALTDEQCRKIQQLCDPNGTRINKDWELVYQPTLVRLYMSLLSFTKIQAAMASKIEAWQVLITNKCRDLSTV
jgi:hypothetical protein